MSITSTEYTTHQGIAPPYSDRHRTAHQAAHVRRQGQSRRWAYKRRGVEIEPERIGARIELADWSLHLEGRG